MIRQLTKSQWKQFSTYQKNWRDYASTPIDKKKLFKYIGLMYEAMGYKMPLIIIGDSPFNCLFLASLISSQLDSQLRSQLDSRLRSQLDSQLDSQLRSQLDSQLYSQLDSQLDSQLGSQLIVVWWGIWACYYKFANKIGVKFPKKELNLFTNFIKEVSYIIPYQNICFISEKPKLNWKQNFLHNEKGKAVEYRDGWGWYALNGTVLPEWLVLKSPQEINPIDILKLENAQQRAEGIRKIGVEKLWHKCCKTVLDKQGNYELGLLPINNNNQYWPYLKMLNPSVPELWHVEAVGKNIKTVEQALNWRKPAKMQQIPVNDKKGADWFQQGDVCVWPKNAKSLKIYPKILT